VIIQFAALLVVGSLCIIFNEIGHYHDPVLALMVLVGKKGAMFKFVIIFPKKLLTV